MAHTMRPVKQLNGLGFNDSKGKKKAKAQIVFVPCSGKSEKAEKVKKTIQPKNKGKGKSKGINSPKEISESSKTAELRGNHVNNPRTTPKRSGTVLKEKNPKGSSKVTQSD